MNSSFGSYRSPRTIALIGKYHSLEIAESLRRLAEYLHERGVSVFIAR
jgi:NAD+ kinase